MPTKVSQQSSPIVPTPLSSDPDDPSYRDQDGSTAQFRTVERVHGRCSRFCANDDVPTSGATITEHGAMCRSKNSLVARLIGADGRHAGLYGSLVAPYLRGIYRAGDAYAPQWRGWIELAVDFPTADGDWEEGELYLNAEQARAIAAGLTYLADELDCPDEPLRNERARREAEARTEGQA